MPGPFAAVANVPGGCGCCACPQLLCVTLKCGINERPVSGATVEIYLGMTLVDSGTSNSNGQICFTVSDEGTYDIVVTAYAGTACECIVEGSAVITCTTGATAVLYVDCPAQCCWECGGEIRLTTPDGVYTTADGSIQLIACRCCDLKIPGEAYSVYTPGVWARYFVLKCPADPCNEIRLFRSAYNPPLNDHPCNAGGSFNVCNFIDCTQVPNGGTDVYQLTITSCCPFLATDGTYTLERFSARCPEVIPPITITVISDEDSSPLSGCSVEIYDGATLVASGTTDVNGEVAFDADDGLETGITYTVQVATCSGCTPPLTDPTFEFGDPDFDVIMNCPTPP